MEYYVSGADPTTGKPFEAFVEAKSLSGALITANAMYGTKNVRSVGILGECLAINFLDMVIQDTGNDDGVTLIINDIIYGSFNKDWDTAKRCALHWFMILRPAYFGYSLIQRLRSNTGSCNEWYKLKEVCKREGLSIPEDVHKFNNFNGFIGFQGQKF